MIVKMLCYLGIAISVESSTVITTTGPLRGKLNYNEGVYYYSYQGIPYAEEPTGSLRFMPPEPKRPWTDELDATKEGHVCPQPEKFYKRSQMSENCLFLNIYVPVICTGPLPVFAYIHGGQFTELSGNEDILGPQLLVQREVIYVTMNYRLGALGFLSLDIDDASGNVGIKDVLLALRWIKSNINRFGGDVNKITIGSWSAGAAITHYLTLSTKSYGLFQQVVLSSGSALAYRFLALHPKENAIELGKQLSLEANDSYELLRKLKEVDAFDIVKAQEDMGKNNNRNGLRPFASFVPCIEIESLDAVITKHPIDIITSGIPQNVPILAGFNAQEGIYMLSTIKRDPTLVDILNENFELCIPSNIQYPYGSYESQELAESIRQYYFDGGNISNDTLENFVDLVRDTQFSYATDYWIKLHKERNDSNLLYYYVFDFDGELNWGKIHSKIDFPGACHGDDMGYIYIMKSTKDKLKHLDTRSRRMLDIMLNLQTNFIKYGNPTPENVDNGGITWPECGSQRNHLILNDHPQSMYSPPIHSTLYFWYNVYDQYKEYVSTQGCLQKKYIP